MKRPSGASEAAHEFVRSLECSVRTGNVLQYLDVKTPSEFMSLTKEQVMAARNAGVRTWNEIESLQGYYGEADPGPAIELVHRLNDEILRLNAHPHTHYILTIGPLGEVQLYKGIA